MVGGAGRAAESDLGSQATEVKGHETHAVFSRTSGYDERDGVARRVQKRFSWPSHVRRHVAGTSKFQLGRDVGRWRVFYFGPREALSDNSG